MPTKNVIKPKQIIVVRKDLNMRKGKIAAQAAHASLGVILDLAQYITTPEHLCIDLKDQFLREWIYDGSFTKICVYVESESELVDVYNKAKNANIIAHLVTDSGRTEFKGIPTKTCCAIGPCDPNLLIGITSHLPLL